MISRVRDFCRPAAPDGYCRPGQVRLEGTAKEAIETGRNRLVVAGVLFSLAFLVIAGRLVDVTLLSAPGQGTTAATHEQGPVYRPVRAEIVDRNDIVVAGNVATYSLYADPQRVVRPEEVAERLARMFPELTMDWLLPRLTMRDRRFVWLRRHISPRQYRAVLSMGLAGVEARREARRVYPHGPLFSHVLGFADVDNRGLAGVEQHFDRLLRNNDRRLVLSLDIRLQHFVRQSVSAAVQRHGAEGGSGLIMNINTGEILAMVSLPDFDPNAPTEASREARFNRNTLGTYEMGSTFKIFNTAMALEEGDVAVDARYDATRPMRVAGHTIHDYHGRDSWLTVREIFIHSSNIGSARIADQMGGNIQRVFLARLGLLSSPSLELPEVAAPQLPRRWRRINTITISFGHGLSVSPLQMASAVGGIANDGVLIAPTLLRRAPHLPPGGRRVVSSATSETMLELMREVVERGTGRRAAVEGLAIGGKTGTAEKPGPNGYQRDRMISSFVAVLPADRPEYVVLVLLDEPTSPMDGPIRPTGGRVAAPVVREIIELAAPVLGLAPGTVAEDPDAGGVEPAVRQTADLMGGQERRP